MSIVGTRPPLIGERFMRKIFSLSEEELIMQSVWKAV